MNIELRFIRKPETWLQIKCCRYVSNGCAKTLTWKSLTSPPLLQWCTNVLQDPVKSLWGVVAGVTEHTCDHTQLHSSVMLAVVRGKTGDQRRQQDTTFQPGVKLLIKATMCYYCDYSLLHCSPVVTEKSINASTFSLWYSAVLLCALMHTKKDPVQCCSTSIHARAETLPDWSVLTGKGWWLVVTSQP